MKLSLLVGSLVVASTMVLAQSNPVPLINNPLTPDSAVPGGGSFTLTVNGTGFSSGSVVNWNAGPLVTSFVSGSQLTAVVPTALIATPDTASVTVVNPAPGGGTSNVSLFTIIPKSSAVALNVLNRRTVNRPFSVATGFFNNDRWLDLALVNPDVNEVSILLGRGDGTFVSPLSYSTGFGPQYVVTGDFNNDGKIDLATDDYLAATVSILMGNGDGTFQPTGHFATSLGPVSLIAGDFNRDGNLDLATANFTYSPSSISVLIGNGDGTFQNHVEYPAGNLPRSIATGDFNRDGLLDLVAGNQEDSTVSIFLGNADGTFRSQITYPAGPGPITVSVADLDRDKILDLVVADLNGVVSILLGNSDGTFRPPVQYGAGVNPTWVTSGDFNGDGKLDLAVANSACSSKCRPGSVSLLRGNGDGTFQDQIKFGTDLEPFSLAVGDFNGDGRLDAVTSNYRGRSFSVLLGTTVAVSPTNLSFPTLLIGASTTAPPVTLTNEGDVRLSIGSITVAGPNRSDFSQTNTCGTGVEPGAKCTITVSFVPSVKGPRSASITISDDGPVSPQVVSLTGTGTVVKLSSSALHFGNVPVGMTSNPQVLTLTNTASTVLEISRIGITGQDFYDFSQTNTCGSQVVAGGSCTVSVTFTPSGQGRREASLGITDNGGGEQEEVKLAGTGK